MAETLAHAVLLAVAAYVASGFAFALAFAAIGVARVDRAARGASLGFRLLILPGAMALWPVLLRRWVSGREAPLERTAHRRLAR